MAVQSPPLYLQASNHPAEDDRRAHYGVFGLRGGIIGAGDLAVTQNGTPNMTVLVATGQVVIPGTEATYQGAYLCENRGSMSVSLAAADATNPRFDLIVARVRDAAYSGATNSFAIEAVTGTPAASPAEPATPANSWVLARVTVAALDTTITNADIVDRRTTGTGQFGHASALGGKIICTSTTRPTVPFEGMEIYETDTDQELTYSGSAWVVTARLGAWTDFSGSVVITQGATPTKTMAYCRYQKIGRMVKYQGYANITSSGTLDTAVLVSLPFNAVQVGLPVGTFYWYYSGTTNNWLYFANLVSATQLGGLINQTNLQAGKTSGSNPNQLLNGNSILWDVTYEATT